MRTPWGAYFRTLWPWARKEALKRWGYATPQAAIEAGNMEALRFLLDKQASISQRVNGETALRVAIRKRNFEAVRLVATCEVGVRYKTAYLNGRDSNGDTFLAVAAREGDLELASVLLEVGAKTELRNKAGYTAIMWSAVNGNVAMTRLLLEGGASPNVPPWVWKKYGKSPLTEAVYGGNLEVVKMLVEAGARLYDRDPSGFRPLELARALARAEAGGSAGASSSTIANAMVPLPLGGEGLIVGRSARGPLRRDATVSPINSSGVYGRMTQAEGLGPQADALPVAVRRDDGKPSELAAIVKYLQERVSVIEEIGEDGDTPLIRAVKRDDLEGARCLIRQGANVAAKGKYERTALLCAAMKKNLAMVKVLIENSLDAKSVIDAGDDTGRTPLMFAARDGDFQMVRFLVASGADVDTHSEIKGRTYIRVRAKRKLPISVYRRSARVEVSSEVGFTALTYAAKRGHTEIVKFLIGQGADVNAKDCFDRTVLMHALNGRGCKLEIIKLLVVEHGAVVAPCSTTSCPSQRQSDGSSSSSQSDEEQKHHSAEAEGGNFCASGIEGGKSDGSSESSDAVIPKPTLSALPLSKGYDVRTCGASANASGAGVNSGINARSMDGSSAIHFAATRGMASVIAYLLKLGADMDDMNHLGFTPLMQLSKRGAISSVRLLVERGADVDLQEEFGRTALFFAVESGRIHIVRYLLERGAKADVSDEYTKETALEIAKKKNYTKIAELLRTHGAKE